MSGPVSTGLSTRCVVPFVAQADQVRILRAAVGVQLDHWRALALVDEVQLVVTELATNVVKHVGEGVPATLVLELNPERIRIELHDQSPALPVARKADCDSECGRGLHLVAAMAADSGAARTNAGKVIWCELGVLDGGPPEEVWREPAMDPLF